MLPFVLVCTTLLVSAARTVGIYSATWHKSTLALQTRFLDKWSVALLTALLMMDWVNWREEKQPRTQANFEPSASHQTSK